MQNLNQAIEILRAQVHEREEEWKRERLEYQNLIADLRQQLDEQKLVNKKLAERLDSIKFAFLPLTDNIKKQVHKKLHHRVKSDTGTFLKNEFQSQQLDNKSIQKTQTNERNKKALLTNFLKELDNEESPPVYSSPINLSIPSTAKINQILINQNNYMHHKPGHHRSSSNGSVSIFARKQVTVESSTHSITEREIIVGRELFEVKGQLRGHLDGIRAMVFHNDLLATASEDCTIKLWDVNEIQKIAPQAHLEPVYTIRQHQRPIFAMTSSFKSSLIHLYSAGMDGVIRTFIASNDSLQEMNFSWHAHTDVIWTLKHHPHDPRLLSGSADGSVKMWKSLGMVYQHDLLNKGSLNLDMLQNPLANFTFRRSMSGLSIPTAIDWICKGFNESIVCGYNDTLNFVIYDVSSVKAIQQIRFEEFSQLHAQPNKVLYNNDLKLLISAHCDNRIRFSDPNSGKVTKTLLAHTDAVTDLCLFQKNLYHMASVSHDGSMRTWDIRKYHCLHEIPAHTKKYDESIHTIQNHNNIVATGGADGIVKIFNYIDVI